MLNTPGLETMLGEKDGQVTPRLQNLVNMFKQANLKPAISKDILGWLAVHYVEFLGAIGRDDQSCQMRDIQQLTARLTRSIVTTVEADRCRSSTLWLSSRVDAACCSLTILSRASRTQCRVLSSEMAPLRVVSEAGGKAASALRSHHVIARRLS